MSLLYRTGLHLAACMAAFLLVPVRTSYYFVARVLRALCCMLPSACKPSANPPRPGDTKVSTAWLASVLGTSKLGVSVLKATPTSLSGNRGLTGVMSRIVIEYQGDEHAIRDLPKSLILKMSPAGVSGRYGVMAGRKYNEGRAYDSEFLSAAADHGVWRHNSVYALPRVYYSYGSPMLGEYVIMMEDATERHPTAVACNMVFGNQIWGVPKPVEPPRDPLHVLGLMYRGMAELHAHYWNDKTLLEEVGLLKSAKWYRGEDRRAWEAAVERARRGWAVALEKEAKNDAITFDKRLVKSISDALRVASFDRMVEHLQSPDVPFTLCHGDFHASNQFLLEDDTLVLFDWSELGVWEPTADLAQGVVSDVKPELYDGVVEVLRESYWKPLIREGVDEREYPFDKCLAAFGRGGVERWMFIMPVLASFPLPPVAIQYFHDQLLAFMERFGTFDTTYELKPLVLMV